MTKHIIIITVVGVIISVSIGAIFVWPKYQEFNRLQERLVQERIKLEVQSEYLQELQRVENELRERQALVGKVKSALPLGPDIPSLLEFLQETSRKKGMWLENVSWREVLSRQIQEERLKEHTLSLDLTGSYLSFRNFLFALERSARLIEVLEATLTLPLEPDELISFGVKIKVHSY